MSLIKKILPLTLLIAIVFSKQDFSQRVTNFSFELLYFTGLETEAHTVISPFGIWTLMTAVTQGTSGNSYDQLRRALNLPKGRKELTNGFKDVSEKVHNNTKGVTLTENNFIFSENNFEIKQSFRRSLMSNFDVSAISLDFSKSIEASSKVNNIISKATNGLIANALNPADFEDARLILTNVIHFKGLWKLPFNSSDTKRESFYDEKNRKIGEVNMMTIRTPYPFTNMRNLKGSVLEIPYGQEDKFSMLIILPHNGVSLLEMYRKFQEVSLEDVLDSLEADQEMFGEEEVDLSLPRFKISTNVVLNKPLNSMGIYDIFDPELANFDELTTDNVFVSKVVHKADIEVTETGTVAAAVTSSVISNRNPPVDFRVNRPFVYLIVEKETSSVIFGGFYSKPSVF